MKLVKNPNPSPLSTQSGRAEVQRGGWQTQEASRGGYLAAQVHEAQEGRPDRQTGNEMSGLFKWV